jgi:hypothetical protein
MNEDKKAKNVLLDSVEALRSLVRMETICTKNLYYVSITLPSEMCQRIMDNTNKAVMMDADLAKMTRFCRKLGETVYSFEEYIHDFGVHHIRGGICLAYQEYTKYGFLQQYLMIVKYRKIKAPKLLDMSTAELLAWNEAGRPKRQTTILHTLEWRQRQVQPRIWFKNDVTTTPYFARGDY